MHPLLAKACNTHILISLAGQLRFGEVVDGLDWNIDLGAGTLRFGDRFTFDAQVLGSESEESGTWLWAWANESLDVPGALEVANRLRQLGSERGIDELTTPQFPVDQECNGFLLTVAAQSIAKAPLFYRCDTGGGWAYFLIGLRQMPALPGELAARHVNEAFSQAMLGIPFDHRQALTTAAAAIGVGPGADGRLQVGDTSYRFDELGRVAESTRTMGPGTASASPPSAPPRPRHRRRRR